jgi:4'-phosphopantetheinyl transferase
MLWRAEEPRSGCVDLYYLDMDSPAFDISLLMHLLSPDELARAERFRFDRHRSRFVVGRAALRRLLADLTDSKPAEIALVADAAGKPALPGAGPAFNLSHSEQHLLIGIAVEGRVGVDVEVRKEVGDAMDLARRYFSQEEHAALAALPAEERSAAFLRVWTRKESLLKALGIGLSMPLDRVSMEVHAARGNLFKSCRIDSLDPRQWCVRSARVHDDLEAAVALDQENFTCRLYLP